MIKQLCRFIVRLQYRMKKLHWNHPVLKYEKYAYSAISLDISSKRNRAEPNYKYGKRTFPRPILKCQSSREQDFQYSLSVGLREIWRRSFAEKMRCIEKEMKKAKRKRISCKDLSTKQGSTRREERR